MITVLVLAFFGGLLLSMPVVFALALGCAAALLWQGRLPGTIVPQQIIAAIDSAPLLAIPLFILFGELVSRGSLGTRLVALCEALVGWIRGGLAHANVLASIFFGGISGAATADTVAVGSVMIPEMKRRGYPAAFSAVVTCTSSVIGNLIPPSIDLIIFAWLTGTPVDRLFAAGLAPGVLIGFSLMAISYAICRRNGYGAPLGFSALLLGKRLGEAGPTLLLPLIILGGIFTGLFTVTESAAIAFVYGLALTFLVYRDLPLSAVGGLLRDSVISIGSIMFLLATALIILTPILHPIAMAMGFDPLHFGILLLSSLALGHVTPPVGLTLFIASGLSGEPLDRLRRPRLPFLRALIVAVLVIAYVPAVTLALPDMLWGTGR